MHASQWAYPVAAFSLGSYYWLKESTAQWAIDAVYPASQVEQRKAPPFMQSPDISLESEEKGASRVYGSYLFFQFLARTTAPTLIAQTWNATINETDQVLAVNSAIPGGFKNQWPKFAKLLWNADPVAINSFDGWDKMNLTPGTDGGIYNINLGGQGGRTQLLNGSIKHLATRYYHFRINDPNVRSFIFSNHVEAFAPPASGDVTTQAFVKKQGSIWQYEHWSDEGFQKEGVKSFCLDLSAERVEELVIAISNTHPSQDIDLPDLVAPRVSVSNVGCWRYQGTASVTTRITDPLFPANETAEASVTLQRVVPAAMPDGLPGIGLFQVESGALEGRGDSRQAGCTMTRSGSGAIARGLPSGSITANLGLDIGIGVVSRRVHGNGSASVHTRSVFQCPSGPPIITDRLESWNWLQIPEPPEMTVEVKLDGTIKGSHTQSFIAPLSGTRTTTWDLAPQRQP